MNESGRFQSRKEGIGALQKKKRSSERSPDIEAKGREKMEKNSRSGESHDSCLDQVSFFLLWNFFLLAFPLVLSNSSYLSDPLSTDMFFLQDLCLQDAISANRIHFGQQTMVSAHCEGIFRDGNIWAMCGQKCSTSIGQTGFLCFSRFSRLTIRFDLHLSYLACQIVCLHMLVYSCQCAGGEDELISS